LTIGQAKNLRRRQTSDSWRKLLGPRVRPSAFGSSALPYPPAIAPTIRNGSIPLVTGSGKGVSGCSCDRSCWQAKNRTKGRRLRVTWSRIVPRKTGNRFSTASSTELSVIGSETSSCTSPSTLAGVRKRIQVRCRHVCWRVFLPCSSANINGK
jgi:hypothetical protein